MKSTISFQMGNLVVLRFVSLHILVILSLRVVHGSITSLCDRTPYPELCNPLRISGNSKPQSTQDQNRFDLRESALGLTLAQAERTHQLVSAMDLSLFDEPGRLAWADCLELYQDTIEKLNRSCSVGYGSYPNTGNIDVQTWLSASITNHQTCLNGFHEFNLSSHLDSFPFASSNFSKYLSNSLAINKAFKSTSTSTPKQVKNRRLLTANGFPGWVPAADRRLLQAPGVVARADIVVAQDGSGDYKTISEAVAASAERRSGGGGGRRFVIYVKAGSYRENVEIKKSVKNLMMIGDGIGATIITGSKNVKDGSTTFRSATFAVSGVGFIARDITFENTAGPEKHQAVALRSGSDFSVFYRCSFRGYQDTLYVYSQRQFYRDCDIYGTVDFIFGDAAAVLQNCNIYLRKPMAGQKNTVTAQGRSDPNENTGIVIHNSRVAGASDLGRGSVKSYLGRPWRKFSRTVFMKCAIDGLIDPAGWTPWSGSFALSTLYYAEYMNTGAGAGTGRRVRWPGYHVITSAIEAGKFSVGNFLAGDDWLPATGVPFASGL